jgi:lipid-A-disaccharide synthase
LKKLFIITGEYSGDIHASNVVNELRKIYPDVEIEGVGGKNLAGAGVKLFSSQEKMGAMGISPKILFDHISLGKRIVQYLENEFKPDLVLLIDYGAFNMNIAQALKKNNPNLRIFYYIPPQVWASRKWRINKIKKFIDEVLCIFPFEKDLYESYGIKTHYCGHPLISQLPEPANRDEFFEKHNLDKNKKLVSIFPGSRSFELKNLMNVFLKTAALLKKKHPDLQFLVSQAPNLSDETYSKYLKNSDFTVVKGENQAMLSVSDALILASGTVALEAALYKTPMIIAYRGPFILYLVYLMVRCINKVSLPNIITGKDIVPEIIETKVSAENICYNIEKILYNKVYRDEYLKDLENLRQILSDKKSSYEAACAIKSELM